MAAKGKIDTFANIAAVQVTEPAANTQASQKFNFPFSIMDKMALIITRIEYLLGGIVTGLTASGDYVTMGLTVAATVTDLTAQNDPLIVDNVRYSRMDFGAAASGQLFTQPFIKDFTSLQGGGLLCAPSPLYAMIAGVSCNAALNCWVKLFYTYIELGTEEYWQLVESRRIISD